MVTNKDTLKLAYSAKSEGIIWKIILDETQEIIVWECRTEDKKLSFFAYDFKKQITLLCDYKFENDWELSINTVKNGILYLNGHESDFSPVQKGLVAFDLNSRQILWQNFSISKQLFTEEGIIVFDTKILPRKFRMINEKDGSELKSVDLQMLAQAKPINNSIALPTMSEPASIQNTRYQLSYGDLIISSYYQQKNEAFNQYLKVEKDGKILIDEIMNEGIQKISFDTFFVWHNKLFYIKNKNEIVTYFV